MKPTPFIFLCLIVFFHLSHGQKPPEKFGKISNDILSATVCPIDSGAHAWFVYDFGKTDFRYASTTVRENDPSTGQKGFQMFFERQFRIKILDNNAMEWANIEIPLYHDMKGSAEEVVKFKAIVLNLDGKKEEKSKVNYADLIKDKKNDYWDVMKCALPNVKAGSVIDVNYIVKSDFYFNLQSWEFQKTIPVLQSEYHVWVPEYFQYNPKQWGYYPVDIERDIRNKSMVLTYYGESDVTMVGSGTNKSQQTVEYKEYISEHYATNVPAFPDEPYITTPSNYVSKIEFELAKKKFPGQSERNYSKTWNDINEYFLTLSDFGDQLKRERFLKEEVEKLQAEGLDTLDLMHAAFETVKDHYTWNGMNSKYTSENLRSAYKSGSGNSADINLTMVLMLRELGFEAYPVVLSTRQNGLIHPSHPSISSFNYVIAAAMLNGKKYLMDATDPFSEINLLPLRCRNNQGWLVDYRLSGWIDLEFGKLSKSATCELNVTPDGIITGHAKCDFGNYGAYLERKSAFSEPSHESFLKDKFETSSIKISNLSTSGLEIGYQDVHYEFDVEITDHVTKAGNLLIFEPIIFDRWEENPFKIEKREYPVEFDYPMMEMHSISIQIPEGYAIEELPEPMIVNMQDKSAKLMYSIIQLGDKIQITSVFSINNTTVLPDQYQYLKQMFDILVSKQKEQVILKKI
jgi:hypothetical protein